MTETTLHAGKETNRAVGRPIRILLVEDSPSDVAMTKVALREGRISNVIDVVNDGEAAIAFVRRTGQYTDMPRPDLILLDLNLPRKDGREVLAELKSDDDLKIIPVVILTTSAAQTDVLGAYALHANCYVTKPVGFEAFLQAIRSIEEFWFALVQMPGEA